MADSSNDNQQEISELSTAEIKKKTISGAISFVIRTIFLYFIALAAMVVLSLYLTPAEFGIFGIVTQIIALLVFFSDIGLAGALIQKKTEPTADDFKTAFTLQQLLSWGIFLVTVIIVLSGLLEQKTGPVGNWILLSLGLSFPFASLKTIPSIMLERKLDFSKIIIPQIVEQLIFYTVLIWGVVSGHGVVSYVPAILIRSVGGVVTMMLIQPWKVALGISKESLRGMIGFGAKFQLNDLLARIKDQLYFLVLGFYLPLAEFGYINWAKNYSSYPYNMTVQNVMAITFPAYARLQHDKVLLKKAIEKSLYFISLVIFPILAGMVVFITPLLVVFPQFSQWQPAVFSLILFTISIAGGAISTPLTNALTAIGKINTTLKLMILWTTLTWVLTPITIYFFGYNGVAVAAFVISFTSILPVVYVKKFVPINAFDQVWRQSLSSLGIAAIGYFGTEHWSRNPTWLIVGMLLCGAAYVALLFLLGKTKLLGEIKSLQMAKA